MSRRARFLEVLGIGEEWVLRRAPAAAQEALVEADADLAAPPAAVVADMAAEAIVQGAPAASAEAPRALAEPAVGPRAVAPQPEAEPVMEPVMEPEPTPEPATAFAPVPALPSAPGADARAAAIAGLDWAALAARVSACTDCGLCGHRTQTVFGVGDRQAEWMLVGEAPGENEDKQGEPFVGQAGKLLDNMLGALGLARGRNVFIANVLKCRPPGNRNPEPDEVAQCEPYLRRQIALVQPKLIVVLGRFAAQSLLRTTTPIGKLRGSVHSYEGIPVVVTYHPAYLLRTLTDKARAWEDLCLAREVHARAGAKA
ncbi:uracil-DNA glycosylase family protein [Cupriavidus sp. 2TAF22]|uniref:uracil-DNA glycosylase n=1 Tax=unclassified Cupriavidus TaxID=2640874 RepID=UPI003F90BEE9